MAWGNPAHPLVICCGGVANVAGRFNPLALALQDEYFVVCPDWVGRGCSGWMREQGDYSFDTYVEQTRQLLGHLGNRPTILLGSSMGACVCMVVAAEAPVGLIQRLILNDTGPYVPASLRARRAESLARFYVFRTPSDLFYKTGVSQKHDGPVSDEARISLSSYQTIWSEADGGRIYRLDIRAMQAYCVSARQSIRLWQQWEGLSCPILVIHGMETDTLQPPTLKRMQKKNTVSVMHVPATGHTPALADGNHIGCIREWLCESTSLTHEFSSAYQTLPALIASAAGHRDQVPDGQPLKETFDGTVLTVACGQGAVIGNQQTAEFDGTSIRGQT
jgi:pimeloyl-ACP methyl ester carboxylesterase